MTKEKKQIESITVSIPSRLSELTGIEKISEEVSEKMGFTPDEKDNLAIAMTEVTGNAIVHGNQQNPDKKVFVTFRMYTDKLLIDIEDQGQGFDPDQVANPLEPENLMKESGRGIFILRNLIDGVEFDFLETGTRVHLTMLKKNSTE